MKILVKTFISILTVFIITGCGYREGSDLLEEGVVNGNNNGSLVEIQWSKMRKLTFDNSAQSENLIDFPVLVKLNSSRIDYSLTQDNGEDIRFYDADCATLLSHEIEEWNEAGDSFVWVKVPQIDGSSNADFLWMYYGNDSAGDGQDVADVWSNSYRLVMHFNEASGVLEDSTSNSNNGTPYAGVTHGINGNTGNSVSFNGTDGYIDAGSDLSLEIFNLVTVSTWVKPAIGASGYILAKDHYTKFAIYVQQNTNIRPYIDTTNYPKAYVFPTDLWTYTTLVYDQASNDLSQYINGGSKTSVSPGKGIIDTSGLHLVLGKRADPSGNPSGGNYFFNGSLDELRISNTARSDDWIAAQYLSMTDAFITFGDEEDSDI